jgi:predicted nucleic acid-binding protein
LATRVYIDTSAIIPFLHPAEEDVEKKVRAFFLDLEHQMYIGVISDLCKLEYCVFLKEVIAMLPNRSGRVTKADIDGGLDKYDQLLEEYGLEEVSADRLLSTPFITDCLEIMNRSSVTLEGDKCRFFGGMDHLHAIIAARCGAGFLATMDKGFRGLRDTVQPMVLWDKY